MQHHISKIRQLSIEDIPIVQLCCNSKDMFAIKLAGAEISLVHHENNIIITRTEKQSDNNEMSFIINVEKPERISLSKCKLVQAENVLHFSQLQLHCTACTEVLLAVNGHTLALEIKAVSRFVVKGQLNTIHAHVNGTGEFDAGALMTENNYINCSGVGTFRNALPIRASEEKLKAGSDPQQPKKILQGTTNKA